MEFFWVQDYCSYWYHCATITQLLFFTDWLITRFMEFAITSLLSLSPGQVFTFLRYCLCLVLAGLCAYFSHFTVLKYLAHETIYLSSVSSDDTPVPFPSVTFCKRLIFNEVNPFQFQQAAHLQWGEANSSVNFCKRLIFNDVNPSVTSARAHLQWVKFLSQFLQEDLMR